MVKSAAEVTFCLFLGIHYTVNSVSESELFIGDTSEWQSFTRTREISP